MTDEERQQFADTLETREDSGAMREAAVALAKSEDPAALERLGELLSRAATLSRLDDLSNPATKISNLMHVLIALQKHPTPATAELCIKLMHSSDFLAEDDRKLYLLPALAEVRPMSEAGAEVFRRTTAEGYYNQNVALVVHNGSPRALALFEEMIRDPEIPEDQRADALHFSILPYRGELAVLQSLDRLLDANLPDEVHVGVIETIFESVTGQWFGPQRFPPVAPAWEIVKMVALEFVLTIAAKVRERGGIPQQLLETVSSTKEEIEKILASRKK